MPPERAYLITCTGCVKDETGAVTEILCEYDPESRGGDPADGRKVKGATIHWVDAATAVDAEVRLYDNLFLDADPDGADKKLFGLYQSGFFESFEKLQSGSRTCGCGSACAFPVYAAGIFLPGQSGQLPGASGL